jgi:hypothetical protein
MDRLARHANPLTGTHVASGRGASLEPDSALVKLAHGILDVLAQDTALLGRQVSIALSRIEVEQRVGAHGGRGRRASWMQSLRPRQVAPGRMGLQHTAPLRPSVSIRRADGNGAGKRDSDDLHPHARPRYNRHLVPFVIRQPATSKLRVLRPNKGREKGRCYRMKYPPKSWYKRKSLFACARLTLLRRVNFVTDCNPLIRTFPSIFAIALRCRHGNEKSLQDSCRRR